MLDKSAVRVLSGEVLRMPRKAHIARREIVPDPIYGSTLVSKFVNCMMYGGKKSTSQQILYRSMSIIEQKTSDDPIKLFKKAIENVKPVLEVNPRRKTIKKENKKKKRGRASFRPYPFSFFFIFSCSRSSQDFWTTYVSEHLPHVCRSLCTAMNTPTPQFG